MKKLWFLLAAALIVVSCSKKLQQDEPRSSSEANAQKQFFQSVKYPLRIDFIQGAMMKVDAEEDGKEADIFDIRNKWSGITPDPFIIFFNGTEPKQPEDFFIEDLQATTAGEDFFSFVWGRGPRGYNFGESWVGNIPSLKSLSEDGYHILLIPGTYAATSFSETCGNKKFLSLLINFGKCRFERKILKRVTWQKPIDANSKEFKEWKARILSLIEEAKRAKRQRAK